ncbi:MULTISPECIES: replication initiation factor domain-containing protein [Bacillaceae]|uniref:replication initiation factor domain-containing protein n=1 Tax=Bacillaceae TaxID=186817 RepID=UPI000A1068FD|nr:MULTISPECIES: replication initiation factor domain-containing protein [Bacillus subtilis group]AYK55950.1 replication initiation factor domain-containing protein [Bacillus subtilis subsp. subtilis]AYK66606.1 replication initiation factor domain-containing protein [Bacillus subtilis subsp. subtilis]MCY7786395.1 replication initiation factor domain-containing protein [Bacillus inaquosorum]MCY7858577.1 replication initiation factor domain-containing protein [Bacillus sonorensis]MEC0348222.1 re
MSRKLSNQCLIDYLRFSIPNSDFTIIANEILGIPISEFSSEVKGSPYPTYDESISFANIKLHSSKNHSSILVDMSGQACRQYEEYMSRVDGWHWHGFISFILDRQGKITRIDLALDIFDDSTPSVKVLQDYIKRGQLSTKSHKFIEINSGRILDGKLTGFSLYIGSSPQILRIYDKKQERKDNTDEVVNVEKWVRWELELTDGKAMQVGFHMTGGKPLSVIVKGILSAHYCFKTQPKKASDFHNKNRLPTMKWWQKFIDGIETIPLKVTRDKITLKKKKGWIEKSTVKSISMVYESFARLYGEEYADLYLKELIHMGKGKITESDQTLIEQRVLELMSEDEY